MMKKIFFTLFALSYINAPLHASGQEVKESFRWTVYYDNKEPEEAFKDFDILVFDGEEHPPLFQLLDQGKQPLGYLSLCECKSIDPFFPELKKQGLLVQENANWSGSYIMDVRGLSWNKRILENLIPRILHHGFEGIFIDTVDNAGYLENKDPKKYAGMRKSAINIIKSIRHHYPHIVIMLNRGYDILEEVAPYVDIVLGESVYTDYNFKKKEYFINEESLFQQQVQTLKKAQTINPNLKVFTLDYWPEDDWKGIVKIYAKQRENGFHPYVSTINLNKVMKEPKV